jgi:hypothetical protein
MSDAAKQRAAAEELSPGRFTAYASMAATKVKGLASIVDYSSCKFLLQWLAA